MRKNMIGDTVVCVIDEIGEVTFCNLVLDKNIGICSDQETAERTMAALVELLYVVSQVLPTSASGALVMRAHEQLIQEFPHLANRLAEQMEFNASARQG